jgi:hypothetical protein
MEEKNMNNEMEMDNAIEVDINDNSAIPSEETEEVTPSLYVNLLCGAGISVDEEAMNWDDVYDCTPQLEENIMTLKSMIYDIMKMPSTTEADINARNNAAESIFTTATEFLKSSGLHDLDYDLRSDITIVEKATIACMDGIMIAEALISYARIAQLSKVDTSSLLAEMMENAHFDISMDDLDNLMDTVKHQTSENPLPAMKEEAVQEEVNDENITS